MGKKTTEILCIMDRSGSMATIIGEAVNAFNQFVEDQKKLPGKAKLTLAAFDNQYELIHDRVDIQETPTLNVDQVHPCGMTALFDAIGKTVANAKDHNKTICLIQTDGMENASEEFHADQIKQLVKNKEAAGWEFHFIGAGIDAFTAASNLGIAARNTTQVDANKKGMEDYGTSIQNCTASYRAR